jgi:acyl dehydratase
MVPRTVSDIVEGQSASRTVELSAALVDGFAALAGDRAPVHLDEAFAKARGFEGRIAHGFLVGSMFSGLLGQELPGPNSVIAAITLKMHKPALVGERATCTVRVEQVSEAVGAVVLALEARGADGTLLQSGRATCTFPAARPA